MGNPEFCQVACLMMFCVPSLDPVSKITAMSAASITDSIVSLMRRASFLGHKSHAEGLKSACKFRNFHMRRGARLLTPVVSVIQSYVIYLYTSPTSNNGGGSQRTVYCFLNIEA